MPAPSPETFSSGQRTLLVRIARGEPLAAILEGLVHLIEHQAGGMVCSVLLVDRVRNCVVPIATPNLPAQFSDAINGGPIGPREGSCGAAAFRGKRVIVEDIATHPFWVKYKHLALPHNLLACWSSPILSPEADVLGTFAMYYSETRGPTAREIELVDTATHLAAIAIMRDRAELSLRDSEARSRKLARLYAISNTVNEAIARVRDPLELYDFACRIAVDQGLAKLAWIGILDQDGQHFLPVARCGRDGGYIDVIARSLGSPQTRHGPAGRAMDTGKHAISRDIATDDTFFWKDEAVARGFRSCAVFPLNVSGRTIGIFSLYTDEADSFGEDELRVLDALLEDIAFGVESAVSERVRGLIYRSVNDVLFLVDVETNGFRFASVNPAFMRVTGLASADVVGKLISDVIPEPSLSRTVARFREAMAGKQSVTWEEITVYPVGARIAEVTVTPVIDAAGRCTSLVGAAHDLTARKKADEEHRQLETQLHQSQRMQALGTLAGGIAHDFNNILTAIRGYADIAISESDGNADVQESLGEINRAARRATDIVRRILTFSRQQEPRRETLRLEDVVDEALKLIHASFAHIDIRMEFLKDTPRAFADATQVHQIVMNLATNASHAMNREGRLVVRTERFVVDAVTGDRLPGLAEGVYAKLQVSDTGCGMDAVTLARVFEPFFTTKPAGEGTGLGLSVVHGIMKSHEGAVTVESTPGIGTTFNLYFPASQALHRTSIDRPTQPAGTRGQRILYVDDDEALVFLSTRALERLGYRVTGFADSTHALREFRARPDDFHAVVTDVNMPGLTGFDFVREVLAIRPAAHIVMMSGYVRADHVAAAQALGVGDIVPKPGSVDEFGRLLQQLFSRAGQERASSKDS